MVNKLEKKLGELTCWGGVDSQLMCRRLLSPLTVSDFFSLETDLNPHFLLREVRRSPLRDRTNLMIRLMPQTGEVRALTLGINSDWGETTVRTDDLQRVLDKTPRPKELDGATIYVDNAVRDEVKLSGLLTVLSQELRDKARLLILDNQRLNLTKDGKIAEEEIAARSAFLESYGFVDRHFGLTRTGTVNYWSARKSQEAHGRNECDLTARPWYPYVKQRVIDDYQGYRSVDTSLIDERCRHSQFALRDYQALENGYGVRLTSFCGCVFEISLEGSTTLIVNCPDEDCSHDGGPVVKKELLKLGIFLKPEVQNQICERCGGLSIYLNRSVLRGGRRGDFLIDEEVCCSHCGHADSNQYWVPESTVDCSNLMLLTKDHG